MPDASEASIVRKALQYANSDLCELHGDIASVQAILDELRLKRQSLRKFTIEQDAFLAPIRRLPAEILIEIFMLCINYSLSSCSPNCSPLLFGQVCRGWQQVALSTQKLWSSITVTYYRPSRAKAKLWISRTSSAPLTICLTSVNPQTGRVRKIQPVIAVLVQHCDQWRHLDLRLHNSMLPCLSSIKHCLPWLESIRIEKPTQPRELDVFEVAPCLHTFISGPDVRLTTGLKVPWHQLTDLNTHIHTITECLNILQLVPNLVKCTLYNQSSLSETSTPLQNISILTFPHLRCFSILQIHPDNIFKHLWLLVIHTLHVTYLDDWRRKSSKGLKWFAWQPFMSLLSCSSHTLRKLVIDHLDELEDSAHIAHCLRATPSLEALCL
jgi:F-box-like